uniref:ATP-dependent DNA helicase n=1 Tax=Ditylenchus dipsaci TaxID=166011 RepID=A0A915DYI8_9BILA
MSMLAWAVQWHRMIITELHSDVIRCRIINESSRMFNQVVNLPRFKFEYDGSRQGGADERHFFRTQFPIRLAFAMTINKAQARLQIELVLLFTLKSSVPAKLM